MAWSDAARRAAAEARKTRRVFHLKPVGANRWRVEATVRKAVVGSAMIHVEGKKAFGTSLEVKPEFRRRGIASGMYDRAERLLKVRMGPRFIHSEEGEAFWAARRKKA